MNDKFKKQLKEAILELLISRLDEQDPKAAPKVDPVVQRPKSTYNAPKTIKPAPSMPRSVGTQAAKSGIGKLLGRGASKFIPVIGQLSMAAEFANFLDKTDPEKSRKNWLGDPNEIDPYLFNKDYPEPKPKVKPTPTAKPNVAPVAATAAATLSKAASKASTKSSKATTRQTRKPPKPDIDDSGTDQIKEPSKIRGVRKRTIGTSPKTDPTERINRTRYK